VTTDRTTVGRVSTICLGLWALGGAASCVDSTVSEGTDAGSEAGKPDASGLPEASDGVDSEVASCFIEASNYDTSCSVDSDCAGSVILDSGPLANHISYITFGNYCNAKCICGGGAVNKRAVSQYIADVSKTPWGAGALSSWMQCFCPLPANTCCQSGLCAANDSCLVIEAGAEDGG
jgi:hypothetical protein